MICSLVRPALPTSLPHFPQWSLSGPTAEDLLVEEINIVLDSVLLVTPELDQDPTLPVGVLIVTLEEGAYTTLGLVPRVVVVVGQDEVPDLGGLFRREIRSLHVLQIMDRFADLEHVYLLKSLKETSHDRFTQFPRNRVS